MPIKITEIESQNNNSDLESRISDQNGDQSDSADAVRRSTKEPTLLKVEGTLYLKDAELLEKICHAVSNQTGRPVTLELSDLSFLDSDSAAVLCRMKREHGVRLEGLRLFIEKVVQLAEEAERVKSYLPY